MAQVEGLKDIIEQGTKRMRDLENQVEMLTLTNSQLIDQMNKNQDEHVNYVPKLKQKIIQLKSIIELNHQDYDKL